MRTRWSDIEQLLDTMALFQGRRNRRFSDFRGSQMIPAAGRMMQIGPRANLYNCGDHMEMKLEVPGIAREDLNIKIQGNYLEVSGSRKTDAPEGYSNQREERGKISFTRSFTLPAEVDAGKVNAHLADGLLTLTLPKAENAKPKRITIN